MFFCLLFWSLFSGFLDETFIFYVLILVFFFFILSSFGIDAQTFSMETKFKSNTKSSFHIQGFTSQKNVNNHYCKCFFFKHSFFIFLFFLLSKFLCCINFTNNVTTQFYFFNMMTKISDYIFLSFFNFPSSERILVKWLIFSDRYYLFPVFWLLFCFVFVSFQFTKYFLRH